MNETPRRRGGRRRPAHARSARRTCARSSPACDLRVPAPAFLQTNSAMCEVLYETALRFAGAEAGAARLRPLLRHRLAQPAARPAGRGRSTAVELQEEAIAAARENAALNGVANVDFYAGDVRAAARPFPAAPRRSTPATAADDAAHRPRRSSMRHRPAARRHGRKALAARGRCSAPSASSTSRATRRPWPATPPSSPSSATGSTTRRAGRHVPAHAPHRDGGALRAAPELRPTVRRRGSRRRRRASAACATMQVGVDGEEGHREQRQRRQRLHHSADGDRSRGTTPPSPRRSAARAARSAVAAAR